MEWIKLQICCNPPELDFTSCCEDCIMPDVLLYAWMNDRAVYWRITDEVCVVGTVFIQWHPPRIESICILVTAPSREGDAHRIRMLKVEAIPHPPHSYNDEQIPKNQNHRKDMESDVGKIVVVHDNEPLSIMPPASV